MSTFIAELPGQSGRTYTFVCYGHVPSFKSKVPCVYCVSYQFRDADGQVRHKPIHIGQTEDFNECFRRHRDASTFQQHPYNCIAILPINDEISREGIERDLVDGLCQHLGPRREGSYANSMPLAS